MATGYIVYGQGADRRRVPVGQSFIIGRSSACSLVVDDSAASRQHLEIRSAGGSFFFLDLGSSNGTKINGSDATNGELTDGDQITIGTTTMTFEVGDEEGPQPRDRTMFLQTVLDETGTEAESPPATRSQELLEAAYTLMNALASNFNPCDLVDRVLHTTIEAIDGQRGAVLFAGADGEMLPCRECGHVHVVRGGRSEHASVDEIAISESVARRVLRDGESVRFRSGWADSGVDLSHSIAQLKLSSIICTPIRAQNQIFGILYIDTDVAEQTYSNDDLLLATAAGNSAGLAFLNARNHRAMLDKQRIEQDIEAAWTIQEGFLVRDWPHDDRRLEVYGETQPAKVVGGDFYDFLSLDEDRVGLLIGDVSGKGIPAALTMAQLLAEFRLHARYIRSPAEILRRLNDLFVVRSQRGAFCTMTYFEVDLATGNAVGASAGHHPTLVVSHDEVRQVLPGSGPPVGVLPDLDWQNEEFTLEPGDTVVMYTDGIAEAKATATVTGGSEGGENEFGLERLEDGVRRLSDQSPRVLVGGVIEQVRRFTAPVAPHDDCTMIALRYVGHDA